MGANNTHHTMKILTIGKMLCRESGHIVVAAGFVAECRAMAEERRHEISQIFDHIAKGECQFVNPWCEICRSPSDNWRLIFEDSKHSSVHDGISELRRIAQTEAQIRADQLRQISEAALLN